MEKTESHPKNFISKNLVPIMVISLAGIIVVVILLIGTLNRQATGDMS